MESIAEQFVEDPAAPTAAPTAAELTAAMLVADYVFGLKKFDETKKKSRLQGRGH